MLCDSDDARGRFSVGDFVDVHVDGSAGFNLFLRGWVGLVTPTPMPAIDPWRGVEESTVRVFRAYGL